jgi:hypothetical protein
MSHIPEKEKSRQQKLPVKPALIIRKRLQSSHHKNMFIEIKKSTIKGTKKRILPTFYTK